MEWADRLRAQLTFLLYPYTRAPFLPWVLLGISMLLGHNVTADVIGMATPRAGDASCTLSSTHFLAAISLFPPLSLPLSLPILSDCFSQALLWGTCTTFSRTFIQPLCPLVGWAARSFSARRASCLLWLRLRTRTCLAYAALIPPRPGLLVFLSSTMLFRDGLAQDPNYQPPPEERPGGFAWGGEAEEDDGGGGADGNPADDGHEHAD